MRRNKQGGGGRESEQKLGVRRRDRGRVSERMVGNGSKREVQGSKGET